jgi:phthalate 4,5-dioxygenase oxygenase subunit
VAIRRPIQNANTHDYLRRTVYVAPFTSLIPPNNVHNVTTVLGPRDDVSTCFYFIAWNDTDKPGITTEEWRKFNHAQVGVDLDHEYRNIRHRGNHYGQNREAMKLGNFTGIKGIPNQDIAMWESMGAISDRTKERVGASDFAVVEFRRLMVEAAKAMRDGGPALGRTEPHIPHVKIASFEGVVPKTADWRTLGVAEEKLALKAKQDRVA